MEQGNKFGLVRWLAIAGAAVAVAFGVVSGPGTAISASAGLIRQASPGETEILASRVDGGRLSDESTNAGSATAPAAPVVNRIVSEDGTLDVAVGVYSDCSGHTPVKADRAELDECVAGRAYFLGHNPGVFTPLLALGVGSRITWFDGQGLAHRMIVVARRDTLWSSGLARPVSASVVAQFQTCLTPDGAVDRVLDAVAV